MLLDDYVTVLVKIFFEDPLIYNANVRAHVRYVCVRNGIKITIIKKRHHSDMAKIDVGFREKKKEKFPSKSGHLSLYN